MRTNWGLILVVLAAGCGTIDEVNTPALTRSTDLTALSPDAGAATDATGAGGAAGDASAGVGGATGAGGVTGAAGSGAGGAVGYTCADLLACCDSLTDASQAQLKAQCLAVYSSATTGTTSCGSALAMIKLSGICP